MKTENKWVIRGNDSVFFEKMNGKNPVLIPLDSRVRLYDSKRAAESGLRMITEIGGEHVEFLQLRTEYIEEKEVPDFVENSFAINCKENKKLGELLPVPENDKDGWRAVDRLCGRYPAILKKISGDVVRYAIAHSADDLRYLPAIKKLAWLRYEEERIQFIETYLKNELGEEGG